MKNIFNRNFWNKIFKRYEIDTATIRDWIILESENEEFNFFDNITYKANSEIYTLVGFYLVKKNNFLEFQKVLGQIDNNGPSSKIITKTATNINLSTDNDGEWKKFKVKKISEHGSFFRSIGWPFLNSRIFKHSYFTIDMVTSLLQTDKIIISPCNVQLLRYNRRLIRRGLLNFILYYKSATFKIEMLRKTPILSDSGSSSGGGVNSIILSSGPFIPTQFLFSSRTIGPRTDDSVIPHYSIGMPCPDHCPDDN